MEEKNKRDDNSVGQSAEISENDVLTAVQSCNAVKSVATCKRKNTKIGRSRKKKKKIIPEYLNKGEVAMMHKCYSSIPLTDTEMTQEVGVPYVGYGTGVSHEKIILGAGGEIGYDGFRDPRQGHDGPIYADRVFINQRDNNIQGINFNDAKGQFCCSYVGDNYKDIKEQNNLDCQLKKNVEFDECGVMKKVQDSSLQEQQNQINKSHNEGVKR